MVVLCFRFKRMSPCLELRAAASHNFGILRKDRCQEHPRAPLRQHGFVPVSLRQAQPGQALAMPLRFSRNMQKEMALEFRTRRLHAVEHDKELTLTAQIKKLARNLARLAWVIARGDVRRCIGVIRGIFESYYVAAFARQSLAFINVTKQASIIFVILVASESFIGVEDGDEVENQRTPGVVIGIVMALAALPRDQSATLADQEMPFVISGMTRVLGAAAEE